MGNGACFKIHGGNSHSNVFELATKPSGSCGICWPDFQQGGFQHISLPITLNYRAVFLNRGRRGDWGILIWLRMNADKWELFLHKCSMTIPLEYPFNIDT